MLTDTAIRNAKPKEKPYKVFDEKGLFLWVRPTGAKWWRFRYLLDNKEKMLSLGTYPDVGLAAAREKRDDARKLLAGGVNPSDHRKAEKTARADRIANDFESITREWFEKFKATWVESHSARLMRRFEKDIFPYLGKTPIAEVKAPLLLETIRRIEKRGALESAHRALNSCGQVFRYAVATGRAERDISVDLRGALPQVKERHFAAVTDSKQVGPLLQTLDEYAGTPVVAAALNRAPLVFVRPGELRQARWADISLETAEWRFVSSKTGTDLIVPLSRQAVEILTQLRPLTTKSPFVFPSARTNARPMSDNAILAAMRRLGITKDQMSGHGFRAMARTILDEELGFRPDYIEQQLAHTVKDPNGRAYNRTRHLEERRKMMQTWADYLDAMKTGAALFPIGRKSA